MTRQELIEALLVEISSEEARKLPAYKRKEYASDKHIRPAGSSRRKGSSVRLARARQRNKAKGYFRRSIGQVLGEKSVVKK